MSAKDRHAVLVDIVDRLLASNVLQQAQIENLITLFEFLGKHVGLSTIDGLSIRDWFQKEKVDQTERILIHFENQNPGAAALLQLFIDEKRLPWSESLHEE
jgi:hypothetical protein